MKKIECILLVDDSVSTNFYNKKLIENVGAADQVHEAENGMIALDYICKRGKFEGDFPIPNIIFLDINMPKMNGFEFLEAYTKLNINSKLKTLIIFLTTSNWTKDKLKAIESGLVHDFLEKPLTKENLKKITQFYNRDNNIELQDCL